MLVLGDSHVRRLFAERAALDRHLNAVQFEWLFRGGSGVEFVENNSHRAAGHRVVVLMAGGNSLSDGMSPRQLADRMDEAAHRYLDHRDVDCVIITSLWPRVSRRFNAWARQYAAIMERRFMYDPQVTFWLWDRRQPWRTSDGVHLTSRGYRRAITYLVAAVVWAIHHNQW